MAELKPCPFCGGEAVLINNGCFVDVSCKNFHCRGWADSLMWKTKQEAIEAWNRRAEPQKLFDAVCNIDWGAKVEVEE